MSTKTTFKRIALVAVAALGLGVLSVAPSQAAPISTTVTAGDAGATTQLTSTTVSSDTTTGTFVTVTTLFQGTSETSAVTFVQKSAPTGATVVPRMIYIDTTGSTTAKVSKTSTTAASEATRLSQSESETAGGVFYISNSAGAGYAGAKFSISLESATATAKTGTYVYTVVVTNYTGATASATQYTTDVSIVVSASTALSTTPSAVKSYANLIATGETAQGRVKTTADDVISKVSTAGTAAGYIFVGNRNSSDASSLALDSLTATVTGAGVVCSATLASPIVVSTCGKSVKVAATGDYQFAIQADGTAGASTVTVASGVLGVSYSKSLTFYASAPKTWTTSVLTPRLVVGTNDSAVVVTAVDANGTNWAGTAYIYAATAADALIGGSATTGVACVASSDKTKQYCPITTKAAGTANFKISDKSDPTIATAVNSDAVSVTATLATAATVKLAFDKATYAPGEKAVITVTPVDASGNAIAAVSSAALLSSSTAAITSNVALTVGSSQTATIQADGTALSTAAYAGTDKTAGAYSIVVYMPLSSVTVTITAKGGSALPLAGQVAVTASASVVNASVDAATDAANEATDAANAATDAALAAADAADAATAAAQDASDAVAALSATVAKLVASLKAQITSLTNLVIKIQKKVKA